MDETTRKLVARMHSRACDLAEFIRYAASHADGVTGEDVGALRAKLDELGELLANVQSHKLAQARERGRTFSLEVQGDSDGQLSLLEDSNSPWRSWREG